MNTQIDRIKSYLAAVAAQWKTGAATELSYRAALSALLTDLIPRVTVVNEPAHIACGAPDLLVRSNGATRAPVGYVETKDIGDGDLDGNGRNKEQFDRYKQDLDNIVFTDYLDFRFYGDAVSSPRQSEADSSTSAVRIADVVGGRIVPASDETLERFAALLAHFGAATPRRITSPARLAALMAGKARLLARAIASALAADPDGRTPLAQQRETFRKMLIHDLTDDSFADVYAQTITYGLFAARLHDATPEDFSRAEAATLLPRTNPLLRKMFLDLANDLDPSVEWIVDDLVALFAATDLAKILKDYGKSTERTDPILHFYEDFLSAYNPALRKQRGVWYTPDPVVNFIVRAVDRTLVDKFGLPDGLADSSKTTVEVKNDAAVSKRDKPTLKREMHRVQVLDPSAGTGTFIAAVIKLIHAKFANMAGQWPGYVRDHLLPRLNGFEILMASYAMAHLKIDQLLASTDYVHESNERLRVFLTNSLEEWDESTGTLWAAALAQEAQEANYIKRDCPVMVVMGNPPYSGVSCNNGAWISNLVGDYKHEPGTDQPLKERKQWLNDDYVKFLRLAEQYVERNGQGIVAFINNNGFIDNPTFRGMRWHLLNTFDEIYILNLHGNAMKKEIAPDGGKDENVFDIMVGTSINIFVKRGDGFNAEEQRSRDGRARTPAAPLARVYYADLYGTRESKYSFLESHSLEDAGYQEVKPTAPFYFFSPKNEDGREEYERGFKLDELMPLTTSGIVSMGDSFAYADTKKEISDRIADLLITDYTASALKEKFSLGKNYADYVLASKKNGLQLEECRFTEMTYRPFDSKWTYYDGRILWRAREKVMDQLWMRENMGLCVIRIDSRDNNCATFVTTSITDKTLLSSKDNANVFPLYLYSEKDGVVEKKANLNPEIVAKIAAIVSKNNSDDCQNRFTNVPRPADTGVADINPQTIPLQSVSCECSGLRSDILRSGSESHTDRSLTSEDIFHYVYGVLHTPSYRSRYREFLKVDFPRIPYPASAEQFRRLAAIGAELVQVHLLKAPSVRQRFSPVAAFPVQGDNRVEKVTFQAGGGRGATALPAGENGALGDRALPAGENGALGDRALPAGEECGAAGVRALPDENSTVQPSTSNLQPHDAFETNASTGRVYVNKAQYFDNVPQSAWEFFIGGYQPAQKWLKDRKGRVLSYDDTIHYKSIILALLETRRLMDAAEQKDGG